MRNKGRTILMAAAGAVLLVSGCAKSGLNGRQIRFGVTSGHAVTKAVYGTDDASHGKQAIDWEDGDGIVIASPQATVTSSVGADHIAGYRVVGSTITTGTGTDVVSRARLELADANGFEWLESDPSGGYDFYAAYPATLGLTTGGVVEAAIAAPALGTAVDKKVYLDADGKVTDIETSNYYTYAAYPADKSQFVMTAHAHVAKSGNGVTLRFNPAFTAIEFNITTQDAGDNFTLTKAELIASGSDYLTGAYSFTAGADLSGSDAVTIADASKTTDNQNITVNLENTITQTQGITFTFFTLPVKNTGAYQLKLTLSTGETATLVLNKSDKTAYSFLPGQKYRINLLKLGGQWKYRITINPDELPWDLIEDETTFSQNISSTSFSITGATETGNNYYPVGTKDYQVRTLDMSKSNPYFEVTFIPRAPVGGYWMLTPVSNAGLGTAAFDVYVWDEDEDTGSKDLKGQIMYQPVTLRIYPNVTDSQRTEDHAIIFHSYFSGSQDFDPASTYSADSEIQDIHTDGSFSFWRFVIPAKTN